MQSLWELLADIGKGYLNLNVFNAPCPFELREVEHSLCEMDKYQRVMRGEGRPKSRYNGK